MKNKVILLSGSVCLFIIMLVILIPVLVIMNFFGANITDDYVENNSEYSAMYIDTLNKNINNGNGYVSLSRILYFYLATDDLSFEEIYEDNLDKDTKKQKLISDVCNMEKYKKLYVCNKSELESSNQIDEEQAKPFNAPLDIVDLNVTSFFKEERIVYGVLDIHSAWDFSSPNGTKVYSVCNGTVESMSFPYSNNVIDIYGGGGNTITLKCEVDNLKYYITYAHLYPNSSKVKVGQKVKHWEQIANVGTTGNSTGPHLHYQVTLNNKVVDGLSLIDFTNKNNNTPIFPNPDIGVTNSVLQK